ncbi:MAG: DUF2461 domain-containing protein [Ilumatobacter sp.]|uniref:DUF2461 domain-containing protein n=1 Tax=Ilumatobacter sp. TaxID=1967498 RepID=UPI003C76147A
MAFTGFPPEAIDFYEQLGADNSKAFWEENKQRFVMNVKSPMTELTSALDDYGPFKMFRPHNDLRFSKNKPPYKTHQGAFGELEGGSGHYMQFSADGMMAAAGYFFMGKDQLKRFRDAVVADATGEEIEALVAAATGRRYTVGAIGELKTAPRGYDRDHPRIALIRRKGLMLSKDFGTPKWIHTKQVETKVRECWEGAKDVCDWLDAHVGPSTEPPGDRPF